MIKDAETAVMQLQAREGQRLSQTPGFSYWFQEEHGPHFRLPDPQTKNINFCCFKHPLKNDLLFEETEIDI